MAQKQPTVAGVVIFALGQPNGIGVSSILKASTIPLYATWRRGVYRAAIID